MEFSIKVTGILERFDVVTTAYSTEWHGKCPLALG